MESHIPKKLPAGRYLATMYVHKRPLRISAARPIPNRVEPFHTT